MPGKAREAHHELMQRKARVAVSQWRDFSVLPTARREVPLQSNPTLGCQSSANDPHRLILPAVHFVMRSIDGIGSEKHIMLLEIKSWTCAWTDNGRIT